MGRVWARAAGSLNFKLAAGVFGTLWPYHIRCLGFLSLRGIVGRPESIYYEYYSRASGVFGACELVDVRLRV